MAIFETQLFPPRNRLTGFKILHDDDGRDELGRTIEAERSRLHPQQRGIDGVRNRNEGIATITHVAHHTLQHTADSIAPAEKYNRKHADRHEGFARCMHRPA